MSYTITDIITKIKRRSNISVSQTAYDDACRDYFDSSLVGILGDREAYNPEEVPAVIVEVSKQLTSDDGLGSLDISELTDEAITKIYNIYQSPTKTNSILFTEIPLQEFHERLNNENQYPSRYEGYWCFSGNKLRYFHGSDDNVNIDIILLKDPDFNWGTTDLVAELKYSSRLIENCIVNASVKLKQQIGLE